MHENGRLRVLSPSPSDEEAAAIVAAVGQFVRETAPRDLVSETGGADPWWRAGVLEGVAGAPHGALREPWMGD